MRQVMLAFVAIGAFGGAVASWAAAPPPTPTPSATTPGSSQPRVVEAPDGYSYLIDGRRDPFLSLMASGTDAPPAKGGDGIAGLAVNEFAVRGVLKSRGTLIAMVQGPDKRAYVVHEGDKFLDGSIKAVTPEGLVIVQQVNDPLSLVRQREVRKLMRSVEDGKQ
jgi:Tfp pilus assembly protein PilP